MSGQGREAQDTAAALDVEGAEADAQPSSESAKIEAGAATSDPDAPVEEQGSAPPPPVADAGSGASPAGPETNSPPSAGVTEASGAVADEPSSATAGMKWYVVQAYSGYENKVKLSLLERIKQAGMQAEFGEFLIPKENVQETRGGNKRVTSRNFYPGYIFVQMNLTERSWHLIKDTPKVSGFVGGRHPVPVPNSEINAIARQVAEGAAKPKPRVLFEQGDHVRVNDGAFANFTGTVEEVRPEKQKVRVLVSIFGRATPVELDYGQVEKTV